MYILITIEKEVLVVETKTSLDLLFIMDLTGSMESYLNETKKNLILIMKRIIEQSPGIDINLGFIGYRNIDEEYVDLDFTKEHSYIEIQISDVIASGGGDIPEDVAWAFERALNKSWKMMLNLLFLLLMLLDMELNIAHLIGYILMVFLEEKRLKNH